MRAGKTASFLWGSDKLTAYEAYSGLEADGLSWFEWD